MPPNLAQTMTWPFMLLELLKLFQDLLKALAWPGVLIVLLALFRHEIRRVLPAIRNFKYPGGEINFGDEIHLLAREATGGSGEAPADATPVANSRARRFRRAQLEKLARVDPRSAVMEAWSRLSSEAVDCILRHAPPPGIGELDGAANLAATLENRNLFGGNDAARFRRLARLRNIAKHVPEHAPTAEQALDFTAVAANLANRLRA